MNLELIVLSLFYSSDGKHPVNSWTGIVTRLAGTDWLGTDANALEESLNKLVERGQIKKAGIDTWRITRSGAATIRRAIANYRTYAVDCGTVDKLRLNGLLLIED